MGNPQTIKTNESGAATGAARILKYGSGDGIVVQSSAAADLHMGVGVLATSAAGERVDMVMHGVAEIEYGGAVTRGQDLTSDANGKAIAAAPGAGANVRTIGYAMVSAVDGDKGPAFIQPGIKQG